MCSQFPGYNSGKIDHGHIAGILGSEPVDLRTENAELRVEIERLQAIVDKFPLRCQVCGGLVELDGTTTPTLRPGTGRIQP